MLAFFIPWHKTPLIPPLKMTIKEIYSPGIKVFYAGVVFKTLWYIFFASTNSSVLGVLDVLFVLQNCTLFCFSSENQFKSL